MKAQQCPATDISGGGGRAKMRVLKTQATPRGNSKRAVNNLLSRFLVKGNKAEDILRESIRRIILEELNFFIDQNNQHQNEFSSIVSEKLPVLILNNYRKLTPKEIEVMDLILLGFTNRKIAARLNMKLNTVKNHIKSINNKFGVTDRESACSVYRKLYNRPKLVLK